MRKLSLCFIFVILTALNAFASTSFTVRVSFTIPQRIEVNNTPCPAQPILNQVKCNDAVRIITNEQIMLRNNAQCLVRTVLPK
jgi:hypothetical protein